MTSVKYLLIGGGLSSAMAAKKIRELDPAGSILIVSAEAHLPYNRPPLSKEYMQGKKPESTIYVEGREFWDANRIGLVLGEAVERLDLPRKRAILARGEPVEFEKALLATGGRPRPLTVPGADLPGVYTFRTVNDAISVSNHAGKGRRAVVIGGGFIGMELASSLTQRGLSVSLVHRGDQVWSKFMDWRLAAHFQSCCESRGVTFYLNSSATEIQGESTVTGVVLDSGHTIPCDLVVVAVGIDLDTHLAKDAGLAMGDGVIVDEHMRTSNPDVYAAGDIANFPDPYFGIRRRVEHWGQADYTGALAGANMAGHAERYDMLTYVFSDIFDLHLEMSGCEQLCQQTLFRGKMTDPGFAMLNLQDGRMTAYYAINLKRKQYGPLGKLIEQKVDLKGKEKQLEDPQFDLTQLQAAPVAK